MRISPRQQKAREMHRQSTIPEIRTKRLRLVLATTDCLKAEIVGNQYLARELRVEVPPDWPPEHYDSNVINYVMTFLQRKPDQAHWSMRYIITRDGEMPTLVGGCGFKGQPDAQGMVEIGYGLTPKYQKRGFATEAALALIHFAFANSKVQSVIAHTLPDHLASIGVMLRTGMEFESETTEDGLKVVRYAMDRKTFETKAPESTSN